jgi:hypothetical protein
MPAMEQPRPVFTDDFVLIANSGRRLCTACGEVHPYLSHADPDRRLSCSAPAIFGRAAAELIDFGELVDLPVSPIT